MSAIFIYCLPSNIVIVMMKEERELEELRQRLESHGVFEELKEIRRKRRENAGIDS